MSNLIKKVELQGVSRHGKNRVREQGKKWIVVREAESVHFKTTAPGPFLLLESEAQTSLGPWLRWVSLTNDPDFQIQ